MPPSHLILCRPLLLLPSIFPSIRAFSNESAPVTQHQVAQVLELQLQHHIQVHTLNIAAYSGLISFRIDWLDFFAVQGILRSLLQHHTSKTSILWLSAFFLVQASHPYMTTGKTIALTRRIFASKVMFLLCNILSRLVTAFLPRNSTL